MEAPERNLMGKNLYSPDETRSFDKGKIDVVTFDNVTVGRAVFESGCKWSECVMPVAGTDSCQVPHVGYGVSGRINVVIDDGQEQEYGPGDAVVIPPGHDGWTLGDEACVMLDFGSTSARLRGGG